MNQVVNGDGEAMKQNGEPNMNGVPRNEVNILSTKN